MKNMVYPVSQLQLHKTVTVKQYFCMATIFLRAYSDLLNPELKKHCAYSVKDHVLKIFKYSFSLLAFAGKISN